MCLSRAWLRLAARCYMATTGRKLLFQFIFNTPPCFISLQNLCNGVMLPDVYLTQNLWALDSLIRKWPQWS